MSQPRVSRRVASLEREIGGTLVQRTSRRVRLTPLRERFLDQLRPAYEQMRAAYAAAGRSAAEVTGRLRLGFTPATAGPVLQRLVAAFEAGPAGRPVRRTVPAATLAEILANVALGRITHPTVASIAHHIQGRDIVLIPISDLPPLPLGVIWCTARENARIRALAATVSLFT